MYACICNEVTDEQIKNACGDDTVHVVDVILKLRMDMQCYKCMKHVKGIFDEEKRKAGTPPGKAAKENATGNAMVFM